VDAGVMSRDAADAGIDAGLPDASSPEELLVWFGLRTTGAQRILLAALFDDLSGQRQADRNSLVMILNSVNDLDCVLNPSLCLQVCLWAATRCDVCTDDVCQSAMQSRCGLDCAVQ
jgi:hypothetical protein